MNLSCSGGSPPQQHFMGSMGAPIAPLNSVMNFLMRDPYSNAAAPVMNSPNGPCPLNAGSQNFRQISYDNL